MAGGTSLSACTPPWATEGDKLLDRLKGLKERQAAAVVELVRVHEALKKSATFTAELADSLSGLRSGGEGLGKEVAALGKERFDGVPVFADFLRLVHQPVERLSCE